MKTLDVDVAVAGAGSAGCVAALAAARNGARTVLVDRLGFPGGTSTAALDTFYAFFTAGEDGRKIVHGLPDAPVAALRARAKVRERPNSFGSGTGYTYDPESLKLVWNELLRQAQVGLLLHTVVVDVELAGGRVDTLVLAGKAGLVRLRARAFVDATGDADVIARAGGPMLPDTEKIQPATLTFRMSPVDVERFRSHGRPRLAELVRAARADGLDLPGDGGSLHESGVPGVVLAALTRVASPDYTDPAEPGRMESDALAQVDTWVRFLRRYLPGFERAELSAIGAATGVRETRRVLGRYVLTEADVVSGQSFADQIALCGAPIEDLSDTTTRWQHVGGTGVYGIPWRCLLPQTLTGVVVAGRCLSAQHAAHASARSMGTCMALGQAAGTAAALAIRSGRDVTGIQADELSAQLTADGAWTREP